LAHGPEEDRDLNRFFVSHEYQLQGEMMIDFVAESRLKVSYPRFDLDITVD